MSPERWERVKDLFDAAIDLPAHHRTTFLAGACDGDQELASEVQKLIEEHNRVGNFMSKPLFGNLAHPDLVAHQGESFGDFLIDKLLGSGGMGRVYKAIDLSSGRPVALKILNVNFSFSQDDISRFEREAWIGGRLNHPNIVKALGQGEASGLHYIAMELMQGPSLAEDIAHARTLGKSSKTPAQLRDIILRFAEIADALHYLHVNEIVHRDVKPHNLLMTDSRSRMLLSDFGLARDEQMSRLTRTGDFFGTIRYMSPEQILGQAQVDRRSDIWSLGVSLYEAVTLDLPYSAPTEHSYIAELSSKEPIPPRVRDQTIPRDLETVLMNCLEKDPALRYQQASDLRDDLRRLASNEPIRARRPGAVSRSYRYVKRRRRPFLFAAALSAFLIAAFLLSLHFFAPPAQPPVSEMRLFNNLPGSAFEPYFSPDDKQIAFVFCKEGESIYNIYTQAVDGSGLRRITNTTANEGSPVWSPDGQNLAFVRYAAKDGNNGVFISRTDGTGQQKLTPVAHNEHVFARRLDWSPDGKHLALVDNIGPDESTALWLVSASDGSRTQITHPAAGMRDVAPVFSPDGKTIAFLRFNGHDTDDIYLVPVHGGQPRALTASNVNITDLAWLPNGNLVFYSNRLGVADFWIQPLNGGLPVPTSVRGKDVNYLHASHKTNTLVFSRWESAVRFNIWQVQPSTDHPEKPSLTQIIESPLDDRSPQYSPDGSKIAFRSKRSGTDEIWVADSTGKNPVQISAFRGPLTGTPRWSPDGRQLAFDSQLSGKGHIYAVSLNGVQPRQITDATFDNLVPSWSRDMKWIYFSSNRYGGWQIWKAPAAGESSRHPAVQVTHHGGFSAFESPDGKWVYYAKGGSVSGLWRVPVGGGEETIVTPELQPHFWGYWAICPAGIYFIHKDENNQSSIRKLTSGTGKSTLVALLPQEPPYDDSGLTVTPDGQHFLYPQMDRAGNNILLISNFH